MKRIEVLALNSKDKFIDWIENRGGIQIWIDQNLSTMSGNIFTPVLDESGIETSRPKYSYVKDKIITDINYFLFVKEYNTVKTIRIATRLSGTGLYIKLTNASSEKLRKECNKVLNKYGVSPVYEFCGDDGKDCAIKIPIFDEG